MVIAARQLDKISCTKLLSIWGATNLITARFISTTDGFCMTKTDISAGNLYMRPTVIINDAAGSTQDISVEITSIFVDSGLAEPIIHLVDPENLDSSFQKVIEDGTDLLVIYGGDGTCKSGALVAREAEIPLIALPGGTMNMLPKALYGTDEWRTALTSALTQPKPRWQPAGNINGHIFFCGAILGDPIVMSQAREVLRDGDILKAAKQVPEIITAIAHGEQFKFEVDGELFDKDANGLQIYCPYMTSGATLSDAFELASVPQLSVSEVIGIGARAMAQDWRDSIHVKTAPAKNIQISGQGVFNVLLDGEAETISCPIVINLEQKGVLVLAPSSRGQTL